MDINEKIKIISLYDIYYDLFTKRQQEMFELFFDDDYSMYEIANNLKITVPAVSKTIKEIIRKLYMYEDRLKIESNYLKNVEMLKRNNIDLKIINQLKK